MSKTRQEIHIAALERQIAALDARIGPLQGRIIPFVNTSAVIDAALEELRPLLAERAALLEEVRAVLRRAS